MKNNNLWLLSVITLFTLIMVSCGQKKQKNNTAVIKGEYFPFEEYLFLNKVTANTVKTVDSAVLSGGGSFMFKFRSEDDAIFRLAHKELYPLMVIAKNGDTVNIKQTNDKAWPYIVSGSEECMILVNYLERLNRDHYTVDSMANVFMNSQDHPDFLQIRQELNHEFIKVHEDHKEYARQFITAHPSSLASIVVINGFFKEFALFNHREDYNYYEILDKALMEKMPTNRHVLDFHEQILNIRESNEYELEAKMRLSPGRIVPEFELPSTSGLKVGPQHFRDNVLLIYFWAGMDAKSRQTNPLIKAAYETFSPVGFQVLAISFDKDPTVWEEAIKLDELPGVHATDLKGAGSPVQKLFNLKMQLPYYFLLDSKGRISDHDGDFSKLQAAMVEIYNQNPDN